MSRPIEEHGVVGDLETLAIVASSGDVDWFCWPRFDSPSVFGGLLDDDGGRWRLHPAEIDISSGEHGRQLYLSGTNVLITRFHTSTGVVEIEDFMDITGVRRLVRRIRCLRGSVDMTMDVALRPDYGRADVVVHPGPAQSATITFDDERLQLVGTVPFQIDQQRGQITARFTVEENRGVAFSLGDDSGPSTDGDHLRAVDSAFEQTLSFWQNWTDTGTYRGRWREAVERSALVLKLLTHRPTGGVIAAGTTSIPETVGGERNWDYRYVWIRDAAFTVYALLKLGHADEAEAFAGWLVDRLERCADPSVPPLSPLYDLDGNADIGETTLDHWSGYADSRPVRVGNAASDQIQLDIYGELIDSLYLTDKHREGLDLGTWQHVCTLVDYVLDHWREPGNGMWEVRQGPQRFTSTLLMSWVAVERAIRMAEQRGRPADLERWRTTRDEIHDVILEHGWSDAIGAFTQVLDGASLDASILLAPLVKFIAGTDPLWHSTLDAIGARLAHGPLVDRYDSTSVDDGLDGDQGSFTICSFWYVEALARAGRVDEAQRLFDRLLTYSSPLGLFSEAIGPTGRQLGNFPQAFTHLALISAATLLDEVLDEH